ncbi:PH domain-containing protein [Tunicatimonas pelagia]|uniref:PH domain-containing protein n=1 Tax=Tunicatimonas pelagia TaxID=931531 RepID=UPI0026669B05|nr:PH domain-containing protein [Tunicatimonas pelagia]WKN46487.1 PH domain-containing protein [Tunicatimonas pelagia]
MEKPTIIWKYKPHQGTNIGIFLSSFTLVTLPWVIWSYLKTRSTEYRIEGGKLYARTGIWPNKELEIYLFRIKSLQIKRSFANVLGLHTLTVLTENDLVPEIRIEGIVNLKETENIILHQIDLQKRSRDTTPADDP